MVQWSGIWQVVGWSRCSRSGASPSQWYGGAGSSNVLQVEGTSVQDAGGGGGVRYHCQGNMVAGGAGGGGEVTVVLQSTWNS